MHPPTIVRGFVANIEAAHMAHMAIHRLCDASELVMRTRMMRLIRREQHGQIGPRRETQAPVDAVCVSPPAAR